MKIIKSEYVDVTFWEDNPKESRFTIGLTSEGTRAHPEIKGCPLGRGETFSKALDDWLLRVKDESGIECEWEWRMEKGA